MKTPAILLLTLLLPLLAGCSLFGIATKDELGAVQRENEARRQVLQQGIGELRAEIADLNEEVETARAALAEAQADRDRLRGDLQAASAEAELLDSRLATVAAQVEGVDERVLSAERRSERALEAQLNWLLEERERLRERLETLDAQIRSWQTEEEESVEPAGHRG